MFCNTLKTSHLTPNNVECRVVAASMPECKRRHVVQTSIASIFSFFQKKPRKVWRFAINSLTLPRQNHSPSYGAGDDIDMWRSRGY